VAITQISQITNRKGLQIDLPQLAGAELGWSIDSRRLWIGNGEISEGAPVVGNTEILTEFSDILAVPVAYTFKGEAAGYPAQTGPTPGDPIKQSIQSWMDQWVSVKDFGAVGDGVTDDTAAINRALYQIYCININPQVRRAIFFPAGLYRITNSIKIPPYATLYGEGLDNSIIQLDQVRKPIPVARTADSQQNVGTSMGSVGAISPRQVTISDMSFVNLNTSADVFLFENVVNCRINSCNFQGALGASQLNIPAPYISTIRFSSTPAITTGNINFSECNFTGATYGFNSVDSLTSKEQAVKGVNIDGCSFNMLYQGVVLGMGADTTNSPTGFRITNCVFDKIYAEGILIAAAELNASGYNIFYDVGDQLLGLQNPCYAIIEFRSNNNLSIGDMFARTDDLSEIPDPGVSFPRVLLSDSTSIAITNSAQIAVGTYVRQSGQIASLVDNQTSFVDIVSATGDPLEINSTRIHAFAIDYTIVRGSGVRTGTLTIAPRGGLLALQWSDDYVESYDIGVTLNVVQPLSIVTVQYKTNSSGYEGSMTYSIRHLA
jgi:hypothetical protein